MIRRRYIKLTEDDTVAHLYEHIYCRQITAWLRKAGLFVYIDYHLLSRSYQSGVLVIEFFLYSPRAEKLLRKLEDFRPVFDDESINVGLYQISAEKVALLGYDIQTVKDGLRKIGEIDWINAESTELLDVLKSQVKKRVFSFRPANKSVGSLKLRFEIRGVLNAEQRAIFFILSAVILDNLAEYLADNLAIFSLADKVSNTKNIYFEERQFSYSKDLKITSKGVLKIVAKETDRLVNAGLLQGIVGALDAASYCEDTMPNFFRLYEDYGVILGREAWKKIIVLEKLKQLLDQFLVSVTIGSQKATGGMPMQEFKMPGQLRAAGAHPMHYT